MPRLNVSILTSHLGRSYASRSLRGVYLAVFSVCVSWRDRLPLSVVLVNSMIRRFRSSQFTAYASGCFRCIPPSVSPSCTSSCTSVSSSHANCQSATPESAPLAVEGHGNHQQSAPYRRGNVWRHPRCLSTTVVLGCDAPGCRRPNISEPASAYVYVSEAHTTHI
jgi:hypothetical protein